MDFDSNQPAYEKGVPASLVIVGGLVVLALLTGLVYLLGNELSKTEFIPAAQKVEGGTESNSIEQPVRQASSASALLAPTEVPRAIPRHAAEVGKSLPVTYDIGAYITYGGKAFSLNRAIAKLSAEKTKLVVAFYEDANPSSFQNPPMAVIFDFKNGSTTCATQSLKGMAIVFNLKAAGNIKAQRVELIRNSQDKITPELAAFSCSLRPGTKLNLQLLGSEPNVLKPSGGTFGWGARLTQEIS